MLALGTAVAERGSVWITELLRLSIAPLLTLFAAVLFGPLAAGLVERFVNLGDTELLARLDPVGAPRLKWLPTQALGSSPGAATGLIAKAFFDPTRRSWEA